MVARTDDHAVRRCAPLWAIIGLLAGCQKRRPGYGLQGGAGPGHGPVRPDLAFGRNPGRRRHRRWRAAARRQPRQRGGESSGGGLHRSALPAISHRHPLQRAPRSSRRPRSTTSSSLAFTRSQLAQQEALNQQLESQDLYHQWGSSQGMAAPSASHAEITTAQRMLTVLGLYNGAVDGVNEPRDLDGDRRVPALAWPADHRQRHARAVR